MKAIPHWERNGNSAAAAARERGLGVESGDGRDAAGEGEELDYHTKKELYNKLLFVSAGREASLVT